MMIGEGHSHRALRALGDRRAEGQASGFSRRLNVENVNSEQTMNCTGRSILTVLGIFVATSGVFADIVPGSVAAQNSEQSYDVVVYGATSGGVTAAIQAARMGKSVVLIEPGRHLGGMTSGGLGATDIGNKRVLLGILAQLGLDAEALLARSATDDNKQRLRQQTEEAQELGIFGAPSSLVRGDLFWGDDRLDDAVAWQINGTLKPT